MNILNKFKRNYPYFILIVASFLLLIRTRYGFCWSDESFYVAGANRILNGDRFLTDEWYVSQLFFCIVSVIVTPYKLITGSWEGVYLFYRIVYVFIQCMTCIVLYRTLVKHNNNKFASMMASLVLLFYSRAYINTFSYYAAILCFYIWGIIIVYNCKEEKIRNLFFAGVFWSGVIIINPFFLILVIIWLIYSCGYMIKRKTIKQKGTLYIWAGLVVCGVAFFIFVFKGNSLAEIYQCSFWWSEGEGYEFGLMDLWMAFRHVAVKFKYTIILSAICIIITAFLEIRGKMTERKTIIIFSISFTIFIINFFLDNSWDGVIQANCSILGLTVFLLVRNKRWDIFRYFYVPGLVLAFLMNLSSDTGFSAMSVGFALSAGVSCIFIYDFISEFMIGGGYVRSVVSICGLISMCAVVFFSGFCRIYVVYRDSALSNLKTEIAEGPAKGLYTTDEHYKQYIEVMHIMKKYCSREGNVLILSLCPWAYLCTDMRCGSYTTWRITMDANEDKLKAYYEMFPERVPDVVIDLNENIGGFDILSYWKDVEKFGIRPQYDSKRHTSFLWDYMQINNYNCIPTEIGDIWINEADI